MAVFLSSTFIDLRDHRIAVREALDRIRQPVLRMESFGARSEEPSTVCFDEVDECELFVGLYAHRYGSCPPGQEKSITELEYERACETGKPVLAFIVDDAWEWSPILIEGDPGRSKLIAFKNRLKTARTTDTFTSPTNLALTVMASVSNYVLKNQLSTFLARQAESTQTIEKVTAKNGRVGLDQIALLHTSFRRPDLDNRFRDGLAYYQFEVIVVAPDVLMDRIRSVTYNLEQAWPEAYRSQVIRDRGTRFKMKEAANGTSIVTASVDMEGEDEPIKLNRFIDLRPAGPRL